MSYQGTSSSPQSTQNLKAGGHTSSYSNTWGRVDQEEILLDDIEAATKRIYNQVADKNQI